MVEFTDDDNVIAGVLAHETAHVITQHSMRAVARSTVIPIAVADECGDGCVADEFGDGCVADECGDWQRHHIKI